MTRWLSFCCLVSIVSVASAETFAYVGTYTRGSSEGIYVCRLDSETGALSEPVLAAEAENPSFVAIHPKRPLLYAVSEISDDGPDSVGVMAFSINDDGTLTKLNGRSTRGGAACHVSVDPTGRCVGVANYTGGSCITFPIEADGSLGEEGTFIQHVGSSGANPRRQEAPHAHAFNFNANGTQAFVNDLGKDQILMYDVDPATAKMNPSRKPYVVLPGGGGPRHLSFDPRFQFAVANLEITSRAVYLAYDAQNKSLRMESLADTTPTRARETSNSTAECLVHRNGRFAYVSNRGHNSIAVLEIDRQSKKLRRVANTSSEGKIPRGFGIDPTGKFLIVGNQNSDNVVTLKIDPNTGRLTSTGHQVSIDSPVNVRFYTQR